jgi:hypothetical protein
LDLPVKEIPSIFLSYSFDQTPAAVAQSVSDSGDGEKAEDCKYFQMVVMDLLRKLLSQKSDIFDNREYANTAINFIIHTPPQELFLVLNAQRSLGNLQAVL